MANIAQNTSNAKPAVVAKASNAKPANAKPAVVAKASNAKPANAKPAAKAEQFDLRLHPKTMWIRILLARNPEISNAELLAKLAAGGLGDMNIATIRTIRVDAGRTIDAALLAGWTPPKAPKA